MTQQSYDEMLKELEEKKVLIAKTIAESQKIVQEHGEIIKEAERKLSELETGMQFIKKWFLHETPEPEETKSLEVVVSEAVTISDNSKLEDVVLHVVDSQPGRKFTARDVEAILTKQHYPTQSKNFVDVVQNSLRILSKNGKVTFEKRGRPMKYFSKKGGGTTMFDTKN